VALTGVAVGGCNTVKGAGQDISEAGQGIENAANETQDELNKNNQ
jgi:predicted small secreted protein